MRIDELTKKENLKKFGRSELYENFRIYRKAVQVTLLVLGYSVEDSYKVFDALTNYYFPGYESILKVDKDGKFNEIK